MKKYFEKLEELNGYTPVTQVAGTPYVLNTGYTRLSHSLSKGFPLISLPVSKHFKTVVRDSLWLLSGTNNISSLLNDVSSISFREAYEHYLEVYHSLRDHPDISNILPLGSGLFPYSYKDFLNMIWRTSEEDRQLLRVKDYTLGDLGILGLPRDQLIQKKYYPNLILSVLYNKLYYIINEKTRVPSPPEFRMKHGRIRYGLPYSESSSIISHKHLSFELKPLSALDKEKWWAKNFPESPFEKVEEINMKMIPKYFIDLEVSENNTVDLISDAPFNFAAFAFILSLFAKTLNLIPGTLTYTMEVSVIKGYSEEQIKGLIEESLTFAKVPFPELKFTDYFEKVLEDLKVKESCLNTPLNFMGFARKLNPAKAGLFELVSFDDELSKEVEILKLDKDDKENSTGI